MATRRKLELTLFLVLTIFLAPVAAIVFVSGYGFSVWMYQTIAGPPGTPAKATLPARPTPRQNAQ